MTKEYIERDAAIKHIRNVAAIIGFENPTVAVDSCVTVLERLSAADVVEVKHGRWEEGEKNRFWGTKGNYVCSNCKSAVGFVKFNYCPNCGAKMDR